jgi:hypothetical protein
VATDHSPASEATHRVDTDVANGIVPDEGLSRETFRVLNNEDTQFSAWVLLLWVNDYTPDASTTLANLVEASFAGYSRRTLTADSWSVPTVAAHVATSTFAVPQTWTNGSGANVTVFGMAYYDLAFAVLRYVQRFDAPDIVAVVPGGTITVTPKFSAVSQPATP